MTAFAHLLLPYQQQIEKDIQKSLTTFGPPSLLKEAIAYALQNGGKRLRPALVHIVAKAIDSSQSVTHAALAVEFFHTASLIADDLPCMDDEKMRRDQLSLHRAFDEAVALLASYALISSGYDFIRLNALECKNGKETLLIALENASYNTGIFGATGGQFHDLYPDSLDEKGLLMALEKKTASLFEISFVFGWAFGGGDLKALDEVKEIALHFGRAFQISDDLLDLSEDREKGSLNYALAIGGDAALHQLFSELDALEKKLKKLRLDVPELCTFAAFIRERGYTVTSSFSSISD